MRPRPGSCAGSGFSIGFAAVWAMIIPLAGHDRSHPLPPWKMNPAKKSHADDHIAYRDQASQGITAPRLVKPTYRLIEATHSNRITPGSREGHDPIITIEQTAGASKDIRR
jgi:hypothetical protein